METLAASLLAIIHKLVGSILVLFGVVLFPMPIPVGLVMIVLGLGMLAPYFAPVQAMIRAIRRKSPKVDATMVRFKAHCPRVLQTAIEKTNPHLHAEQA